MKLISGMLVLNGAILLAQAQAQAQAPVESITVERGPCLGTCPVYRFSVSADGIGMFVGLRFTAAAGKHSFIVSPTAWTAFKDALAPYRPQGQLEIARGHPQCRRMATDHPSVTVTWEGPGRVDYLRFSFGCRDQDNEAMARALADAPHLLPVAELIERNDLEDGEFHGRE